MAAREAIGERMLDMWFTDEMTAELSHGPKNYKRILRVLDLTLSVLPAAESMHPDAQEYLKQPVAILSSVCKCLVTLCRPDPTAGNVDDVLKVMSGAGSDHVWLDKVRSILDDAKHGWHEIVQETVRTAAQTKSMLPLYEQSAALVKKGQDGDCSLGEIIGGVKDLPKLKAAMRQGATRKLEKAYYQTLYQYCSRIIKDEIPQESLGSTLLRKLTTAMGLLSDYEGCIDMIDALREYMADRKTDLAVGDLLEIARDWVAEPELHSEVDWASLGEMVKGIRQNLDWKDDDVLLVRGFAMLLMERWHKEAHVFSDVVYALNRACGVSSGKIGSLT